MNAKPRWGLRRWLAVLVLAVVVPLLVFGWVTLRWMARSHAEAFTRGQADTVRALALAVDGEVRAWTAVATALAESPSLRPDRLAEFYAEAQQVALPHDGWVVLTVASGEQLLNTLRPYGAPLAKTSSPETIAAVFRDGRPIVSDVFYGQNAQRYMVAVAVPVVRGGKVVNCLTLNFAPQRLTRVLQGQQVPPTWIAAINDRQGRVVARSQHIEQRIGKPTVPWLIAAIRTAEQGTATGPLTDGRSGQVAFRRLQEVPWTVTLTIPVAEFPSDRPVQWFTLLGVLLGLAALGVTLYGSSRITAPINQLAANALALVQGEAPTLGAPLPVRELEALQQALIEASANAQALQREQERAAVAEEHAKAAVVAAQASRDHAEALQASEERFRTLFESATDAILVTDPTGAGQVLAVNPAACRLFGYAEAEFVGLTREAIVDRTDTQLAPMLHTRGRNGQTIAELTYKRKDGTRFPGELTSALIGPLGENRRAVAIIRDITARKQAEEALRNSERLYRAIGESIDYGIWVCAADGRNIYASESFLTLVGITQEQCSSFGWGDMLHPADAERTISAWKECVRTGGTWDIEHRFRGADGQWHPILARGVPVRDERGQITSWAGINLDISRLKQAEEALQCAKDELEQRVQERTVELSRAVQQLSVQSAQLRSLASDLTLAEQRERHRLANVLHDGLQQILVAARLRAHMLGRTTDPEVRRGAQEIVGLLEEALTDSRALMRELNPPTLQKGGLLPSLEWLIRWMAEKHHLAVGLAGPATPLPALPEDLAVLLYQAVRELLLNTVKYAQVQTAELTLAQHGPTLTLTVADAGAGFDPTQLRVAGGTEGGFGLFGIRERLELLGGRLEIESQPGQGSRFTVTVPLDGPSGP
jgi:PAS domain S-box-containing protein